MRIAPVVAAVALLLASGQAPHIDPASIPIERLTAISGDFSGVRVPELAPRCSTGEDPVTHIRCVDERGATPRGLLAGAVFTAAINVYTPAQRQKFYDAYTKGLGVGGRPRGYTHMPVHLPCTPGQRFYHAIYPPHPCGGEFLNTLLREMYDHTPKWEHAFADCTMKAVRAAFPAALLYWENPAGQVAPKPDACSPTPFPTGRAWFAHARQAYGLRGVLIETDIRVLGTDPAAAVRVIQDGYAAWQDVEGHLYETDIYQKFWDARTEADGVAYNDAIRRAVPWLRGFTSGGTLRR